MKKIICLLCMISMLFVVVGCGQKVYNEYNQIQTSDSEAITVVDDLILKLSAEGKGYTVTGTVNKQIKTLTIKSEYNEFAVTAIGPNAFRGCNKLVSVSIPDSVEIIGDNAFSGCMALEEMTVPDSVVEIGAGAFSDCLSLRDLTIGSGVQYIYDSAFADCKDLVNIYYKGNLKKWCSIFFGNLQSSPLSGATASNYSVYGAKKMYIGGKIVTDIVIPDGVTEIGAYAFAYFCDVKNVTIPDSVVEIGESAFYICYYMENIVMAKNLKDISYRAFFGCCNLKSIIIPDEVKRIGEQAFSNCYKLTDVTIPESVEYIGLQAFANCGNLKNVTFANPNGWAVYSEKSYDSIITAVPSSELSDTGSAAKYLKGYGDSSSSFSYAGYWKRNGNNA